MITRSTCILLNFTLLAGLTLCGCTDSSPDATPATQADQPSNDSATELADDMTALEIMQEVVKSYRSARTYMDSGEYGTHFVSTSRGVQERGLPMTFSVIFERPNRFRISRIEPRLNAGAEAAIVASNGDQLEASISRLEPQRLQLPAPEKPTLKNVAPDPVLSRALFPQPAGDMFPQLELLLLEESETSWLLKEPDALMRLPSEQLVREGEPPIDCYRVQVQTNAGPHTCWIDESKFLLLRIDIENPRLTRQVYPDRKFLHFVWRFDFFNASFDAQTPDDLFRITPSVEEAKAEVVTAFRDEAAEEKKEPGETNGIE